MFVQAKIKRFYNNICFSKTILYVVNLGLYYLCQYWLRSLSWISCKKACGCLCLFRICHPLRRKFWSHLFNRAASTTGVGLLSGIVRASIASTKRAPLSAQVNDAGIDLDLCLPIVLIWTNWLFVCSPLRL